MLHNHRLLQELWKSNKPREKELWSEVGSYCIAYLGSIEALPRWLLFTFNLLILSLRISSSLLLISSFVKYYSKSLSWSRVVDIPLPKLRQGASFFLFDLEHLLSYVNIVVSAKCRSIRTKRHWHQYISLTKLISKCKLEEHNITWKVIDSSYPCQQ